MNSTLPDHVIIADTQILTTEGLKVLLKESQSLRELSDVPKVVTTKAELISAVQDYPQALLIMDYCLLDFENYRDLKEFIGHFPDLRIVILTNNLSRNEILELNNCRIRNILHKSVDKEELFECIDAALKGRKYYSGLVLDFLLEAEEKKIVPQLQVQLTASEIEIVRLIAEGMTNKEIAQKKILSIHTIMTHRKNILRKLGASNASEMIMFAIKSGIIDNIEYHI